jgi:hypothetical protein
MVGQGPGSRWTRGLYVELLQDLDRDGQVVGVEQHVRVNEEHGDHDWQGFRWPAPAVQTATQVHYRRGAAGTHDPILYRLGASLPAHGPQEIVRLARAPHCFRKEREPSRIELPGQSRDLVLRADHVQGLACGLHALEQRKLGDR